MGQMLTVYGVGGKLLKAVLSFNIDSRGCVRVGNDVSEFFPVVGLRQGCVVALWLFNAYMDGVVREVNDKSARERAGVAECEWWQV